MQLPDAIYQRRLDSELEELRASGERFTTNASKTEYKVALQGPGLQLQGSGVVRRNSHEVLVKLKRSYPYPGGLEVVWLTPIFHPNIRPDGVVCIHLLNKWSASQTLLSLVKALRQLLENPNTVSPLNLDAAEFFKLNPNALNSAPPAPRKPRVIS